jgi:tetratricopeptide (TPR) repeat protein
MGRGSQIRRDYSRPFFRKKRSYNKLLFLYGLLLGGFLMFVYVEFDRLQLAALDAVGFAPTPTMLPSEHAARALNAFAAGDLRLAHNELSFAVRARPDDVDYLFEYGQIIIEMVELDLAPDDRLNEVVEIADRIISLAPDDPRGYALKARAWQWSDPAAAIPVAVTGIEQDDSFALNHAVLAVAYTNIARYSAALEEGIKAVTLAPNSATAHRAYSWPLILTGRYDQAIEQLELAIQINPKLTAPYFELASVYRVLEQPEMAVAVFYRILEVDPLNAKAYLRICETYMQVGEFREGEQYCDEAIEIDPNYGSAYRALGQIQYTRRNYEGAIESFQTCVDLGAEDIECYYLRGLAHYILGQCEQAWDYLQQALPRTSSDAVLEQINIGLYNITVNCAGFQGHPLPTPIPPTPIPPTPIGGF